MHTTAAPSVYFRLSLLGHRVLDGLRGVNGSALTKLPLLRYGLVATMGLAIFQSVSQDREGTPAGEVQVATAGLFGAGTTTSRASVTEGDLAAIESYRPAVARFAKELALERSALAGATLLRARDGRQVDVETLARELSAAAEAQGAVTVTGWVAAAGTLFGDAATAEAEVAHLIRRYGL